MSILLVGLNHRSCPVELREQMAFSSEGADTALMLLGKQFPGCGALIVSTCNRLEILLASDDDATTPTFDQVVQFLAQARDLPVDAFRHCLYHHTDQQAVRHLFRVAGGLDSMVLGEYQIVSQLKRAYVQASEQGTTNRVINRLMHQAFGVSGRIRSETEIGKHKVSVPSLAVDVARTIFEDFSDKRTLVIGAGEMAQLVCKHLMEVNAHQFTITSRTLANARALAEACNGTAVPYHQFDEELAKADIVITAVRCPKVVLTAERVREIQKQRGRRLLYILDLAVPRNVDPQVGDIDQVHLQNIDQLGQILSENQRRREAEVGRCEAILDEAVQAFEQWLSEGRSAPLIAQLYEDAHTLRDMELKWLQRTCGDLTDEQMAAVTQLTDRLIGKLMHPCAHTLRQHSESSSTVTLSRTLHELAQKQLRKFR